MPKDISKTTTIQRLLRRLKGATFDQLQSATQWQPHSLRAALTRLRKKGHIIERLPMQNNGATRYRLTGEMAGTRS